MCIRGFLRLQLYIRIARQFSSQQDVTTSSSLKPFPFGILYTARATRMNHDHDGIVKDGVLRYST